MTLYFSCTKMTVRVVANDQLPHAIDAARSAPIVRRFAGQPIDNLRRWMKKLGGFVEATLNAGE